MNKQSDAIASMLMSSSLEHDGSLRSIEHANLLLGACREGRLAEFLRMTRLIFGSAHASINVVDGERLCCLDDSKPEKASWGPLDESICSITVARSSDEAALFVDDARNYPEFAHLPSVQQSGGIRFYAGQVLRDSDGNVIGTFCITDGEPRRLSDSERQGFVELVNYLQSEISRTFDIQRAVTVQQQLMPATPAPLPGYSMSSMSVTALDVGGDFFDFYPVEGGAIITVADVMGKGLGAAILAATVRAGLRSTTATIGHFASSDGPGLAFNLAAARLAEDLDHAESFVTVFYAQLDAATGQLSYIDAGHGLAVIVRASGAIETLPGDGLPLGIFQEDSWISRTVTIFEGDTFVVASDGLKDLITEGRKVTRVFEIFRQYPEPRDMCKVFKEMAESRPCVDDVTLFALRRDAN